jgi:type I restriction enzyme M protein
MSKFQELSSLIWNVTDDVLRGLFKPHDYGDVILPFVSLRKLDCVIEPRKDEIYNLYEEYKSKVEVSFNSQASCSSIRVLPLISGF